MVSVELGVSVELVDSIEIGVSMLLGVSVELVISGCGFPSKKTTIVLALSVTHAADKVSRLSLIS